jgi:UDP-3-O-[3-hydroxymyristoyl] glucosamine N-acyltransferase
MQVKNLLECDNTLTLISGKQELDLQGITTVDKLKSSSLVFLGSKKLVQNLEAQDVTGLCLIIAERFFDVLDEKIKANHSCTLMTTPDLKLSMSKISKIFYNEKFKSINNIIDGRKTGTANIHPSADIGENVFIGEDVVIGANSVIYPGVTILSHVEIGENCSIYPNVSVMSFTAIGNNVRIHSGTTIGSDGFGYHHSQGVHEKIWHFGGVVIGDNVEIGANCAIDQGTFSPTHIYDGVKIDNLVQIAHNVKVESGVILCGQVGLAGSSSVGAYSVLGGKAALGDGKTIGKASQVAGACMVLSDIEDGSKVGGHPARPVNEWLRGVAYLRKAVKEKNRE